MDAPRFDEIVDHATAGLKDDQELRLDVRTELRAHLEDTQRHFQFEEGKDEAESIDLTLRTFGPPLDLADKILDANKRRLKLRAYARLMIGTVLVPLAVMVAVWVGYGRWARNWNMQAIMQGLTDPATANAQIPTLPSLNGKKERQLQSALQEIQQLSGTVNNTTSLRRYWELHRNDPESHIYFAYYTNFLKFDDENYVQEMHHGESIEPQNALYNYRLAQYYLSKGIDAQAEKSKKQEKMDDVLDQQAMEQGIAELHKAVEKPYLRDYRMAMVDKKLSWLPAPEYTEDYMRNMNIAAAELFPELAQYRSMARKISGCARVLLAQGRQEEAERLLQTWRPISRHMAENSQTLIQALVSYASTAVLAEAFSDIYDSMGKPEEAQQLRKTLQQWKALKRTDQEIERLKGNSTEQLEKHAAALAQTLFPVFARMKTGVSTTAQDLAPTRNHEYTMVEQATTYTLLLFLLCALIGLVFTGALYARKSRHVRAVPLLLLPPWRVTMRVLGFGILAPLAVYYLYIHIPVISGRQYAFFYMWPRYLFELVILFLVLAYLPATLAGRWIRKRCAVFGLSLPEARIERRYPVMRVILFLLLASGIVAMPFIFEKYIDTALPTWFTIGLFLILAGWIAAGIAEYNYKKRFATYSATVAKSILPVYAISILLIATVAHPYLSYSEKKWLREDRILFPHPGTEGAAAVFTPMEHRATEGLKAEMLKVLDGAE